ncbi:MAG: hypothetical protein KGQ66_19880 [Acidobacteriota bacterium]|nr:hypothetical protein [Acidobacteriota bacterium]
MRILARAAVGTATALSVLAPASAVFATTSGSGTPAPSGQTAVSPSGSTTWQQVQAKLESELQARVQVLGQLTSSVGSDQTLSPQDKTALSGLLSNETSGINQLLATVEAATPQNTTVAQLRADAKTMVDQYRVYLVMARQVHLTEAADAQTTVETKLENNESRIQGAITKAGNPPDAVAAYNDLVTQVTHATQATGAANIPAVLAVTPQGYPGDEGPLTAARSSLGQAGTDLTAARGDLVTIRNVLTQHDSQINPSAGSTTTTPAAT